MESHSVTVTTDGSGDATEYTPVVSGRIMQIRYVKTDYAADPDFTITLETTGVTIWEEADVDASATRLPRQNNHQTDGTSNASDWEPIYVSGERVKIVVAGGGDTKTGTFVVLVD